MYGARDYLAYCGYGAMPLFQDEIIRGHSNFWSRKKNYRSRIAINIALSLIEPVSERDSTAVEHMFLTEKEMF